MTAISQRIPNFSHGISQQPDYLKRPGQVREAVNCLPDVTQGLLKRPGGRRITDLKTTTGGKWFTIYRDDAEQYLVQYKDGLFKVWDLLTGLPRTVAYTDKIGQEDLAPPVTTPNPGIPSCDINALNLAYQELDVAEANLEKKEEQINAWYANNVSKSTITKQIQVSRQDGNEPRVVGVGHVVVKRVRTAGSTVKEGDKIDVKKPLATGATRVTVGTKRFTDVKVYVNRDVVVIADIYEYTITTPSIAVDKTELNQLLSELAGLKTIRNNKQTAVDAAEAKCGLTGTSSFSGETPTIPDYLMDASPDDIDVLTINDYTFITNKQRQVVMGADESFKRDFYEAFVDIRTLAYGTDYTINLSWTDEADVATKTETATKLSISPSSWKDPDKSDLRHEGEQTFTQSDGVRFRVKVQGQQMAKQSGKLYSRYTVTVTLIDGGTKVDPNASYSVTVGGKAYTVKVRQTEKGRTYATAGVATVTTPDDASGGKLRANWLADELAQEVAKIPGFQAKGVGSGVYIRNQDGEPVRPFTIAIGNQSMMYGFTNEVNDISKLPLNCKKNYVVKVRNTGRTEDDYYVIFRGREGNDGVGVWEETAKPGIKVTLEPSSMPHQLVRQSDGTFLFSPVDWERRLVGDDITNPKPSFVGHTIKKIFFYRNRLGFLSDENCVLSKAGDYFNFWYKSAIAMQASDPVDISASSTYPAILENAISSMQGVLLFSATQQFFLTTDQDVFGPETAKILSLSTFRYSPAVAPFSLGTTVGFLNKAGKFSRFMEVAGLSRETTPELVDQSKIIAELLPSTLNCLAESRENDLVMFGTRPYEGNAGSKTVFGYRYFNDGERRIQSAWFTWELQGTLEHHAVLEDSYYSVTQHDTINGKKLWLMKYDLQPSKNTTYLKDEDLLEYPVSLDNYVVATITDRQYYVYLNQTYFYLPWSHDPNTTVVAFDIGDSQHQGRMTYPTIETDSLGTWCVLEGDWSDNKVVLGLDYEMKVVLPHLYVNKEDTANNRVTADTRSSLVISRVKFNFGESGTFNTTIKRRGREDYNQLWETRPSDYYDADTHSVAHERGLTVPIYDRNTNVLIELRSSHPTPATLFSMDWEGNYSPMYYKSV